MVGFWDKVLAARQSGHSSTGWGVHKPKPMELLVDEHVLPAITGLIGEAQEYLVLVSPYNDYSVLLGDAVAQVPEQVELIAICRMDRAKSEQGHIDRLIDLGAHVYLVERLHAKIYANESQVILTSMNLTQSSAVNSREIALRIRDEALHEQILDYIRIRLIGTSVAVHTEVRQGGCCVRCGVGIAFDPDRPLCEDCYPIWAQYANHNYKENFCHDCGQKQRTTYAKPLCGQCYDMYFA